jgi:hypothetical protein
VLYRGDFITARQLLDASRKALAPTLPTRMRDDHGRGLGRSRTG